MVGVRGSHENEVMVVVVLGGEKRGHLLHGGHASHVPQRDVLVEGTRQQKKRTVYRHTAEGGRECGHSVRSRDAAGVCGRGQEWIGGDGGMSGR